jgi:hypothetical protein
MISIRAPHLPQCKLRVVCIKIQIKLSMASYQHCELTLNTLKTSGNYIYHLYKYSVILHFAQSVFTGFVWFTE